MISITQKRWDKFQRYYTFSLIKVPTFRYGQAFINFFYVDIQEYGIQLGDEDQLWNTTDRSLAQKIINKYLTVIPK